MSSKGFKVRKRLQLNVSRPFEESAQQVSTAMHGAPPCMTTMLLFTSHKTEPGLNHFSASCVFTVFAFEHFTQENLVFLHMMMSLFHRRMPHSLHTAGLRKVAYSLILFIDGSREEDVFRHKRPPISIRLWKAVASLASFVDVWASALWFY